MKKKKKKHIMELSKIKEWDWKFFFFIFIRENHLAVKMLIGIEGREREREKMWRIKGRQLVVYNLVVMGYNDGFWNDW